MWDFNTQDYRETDCPVCGERIYAHMLDRHQEKDHHEILNPTCSCTECVAFRFGTYMWSCKIKLSFEKAYERVEKDRPYVA